MPITLKNIAYLCGTGLLLAGGAQPALSQQVDPALAKSWAFMQQQMPGVSYDLLKDACAEGTLVLYHGTWTDAQDNQVKHFKERFPCINVQSFELETAPLRQRFLTESRSGGSKGTDLVQDTDAGAINKEVEEGLIMKYVISNDKDYDEGMKRSGYWYPLKLAMVGVAWNTSLISDDEAKKITDWKSIVDTKWTGKVGIVDPSFGGTSYMPFYAWLKLFGEDFIKKVGDYKPRIFTGTNPASASLASGDTAIVFNNSETGLLPLWNRGAPIRWKMPEPAVGIPTGQAISAKAPHPNAAKLYQEYAFTLEGYGYWQILGGAPSRIGFKDQRDFSKEAWYKAPTKFFEYDQADATNSNKQVVDAFHKYVGGAN